MTKSTSISGDMCNLEKTDGSQSDTAVSTVGTDDKKRRSSIGAKMQAMVGMSRKSRSTSQLSQTGRQRQCAVCMFICSSVCVGLCVVLCAESCSNTTALFPPPRPFIQKGFGLATDRLSPHTLLSLSFFFFLGNSSPEKTLLSSTPPFIFTFHSCYAAAVVFPCAQPTIYAAPVTISHCGKCVSVTALHFLPL